MVMCLCGKTTRMHCLRTLLRILLVTLDNANNDQAPLIAIVALSLFGDSVPIITSIIIIILNIIKDNYYCQINNLASNLLFVFSRLLEAYYWRF